MKSDDLDSVMEIEKQSFLHPWSRNSFRDVLESRSFDACCARSLENDFFGYLVFSEVEDELHILNLAVHSDHRRKGVATAMLNWIHDFAKDRGRTMSFLEVRDSNEGAQELYQKHGYEKIGRRLDYYPGDREDAVVMRRWLT